MVREQRRPESIRARACPAQVSPICRVSKALVAAAAEPRDLGGGRVHAAREGRGRRWGCVAREPGGSRILREIGLGGRLGGHDVVAEEPAGLDTHIPLRLSDVPSPESCWSTPSTAADLAANVSSACRNHASPPPAASLPSARSPVCPRRVLHTATCPQKRERPPPI